MPSYSGSSYQEDVARSQPSQVVWEMLSQKNPSQKRAGVMAQDVSTELKP
jgi:hypothetical protein